jgi:hypothetical protein
MADRSKVALSSVAGLREEAAEELLTLRLGKSPLRLARLRERRGAVGWCSTTARPPCPCHSGRRRGAESGCALMGASTSLAQRPPGPQLRH